MAKTAKYRADRVLVNALGVPAVGTLCFYQNNARQAMWRAFNTMVGESHSYCPHDIILVEIREHGNRVVAGWFGGSESVQSYAERNGIENHTSAVIEIGRY